MSDTLPRLTANVADALAMLTVAQVALNAGDFNRAAEYLGKAEDAITVSLPDLIALAPDPVAAQAAFDAGRTGSDE